MSAVEPGGEPPADSMGPTVLRMMLGNQLHRFREAAGVTPAAAGYEIRASQSKISRVENGRVGFKERDVADLLTLYSVTDEHVRAGMLSLARQAKAPGWWSKYGDILADWFEAYLGLGGARLRHPPVRAAVRARPVPDRSLRPCRPPARLPSRNRRGDRPAGEP